MTLMDRKRLTRTRRAHGATGDNGVPPSGPQRPAPPITKQAPISKQAPIGPPEVAGRMDQPAPKREPPDFGWLVLLGAVFGVAVLKELFVRIGGPVVVRVKSLPRLPASFWIAGGVGTLGRIGARVLGLRSGL